MTTKNIKNCINLSYNYDKENDILSVRWTKDKTKYSDELDDGKHYFVVDFNDLNQLIGIEIFDWEKNIKVKRKRV